MPRYPKGMPGNGWQISERDGGIFLQKRQDDDSWCDFSGPYTQRGSAYARYRRELSRQVIAARKAGDFSLDEAMRPVWYPEEAQNG